MVYIVLTLIGLLVAVCTLWVRRDLSLLAIFFMAGAAILIADHVTVVWLDMYQYRPGLLQKGTVPDSVLGGLLAEALLVPALAVVSSALLPGWRGAVASTVIVTTLGFLFLKFDLFRHHSWRQWYTATSFPVYFWLLDRFGAACRRLGVRSGWTQAAVRLALVLHLLQAEEAFVLQVKGLVVAGIYPLGSSLSNEGLIIALPEYLTVVPIAYWVVAGGRPGRWIRLAVDFGFLLALDCLWLSLGWWKMTPPFNPFWHAGVRVAVLLVACLLDDVFDGEKRPGSQV